MKHLWLAVFCASPPFLVLPCCLCCSGCSFEHFNSACRVLSTFPPVPFTCLLFGLVFLLVSCCFALHSLPQPASISLPARVRGLLLLYSTSFSLAFSALISRSWLRCSQCLILLSDIVICTTPPVSPTHAGLLVRPLLFSNWSSRGSVVLRKPYSSYKTLGNMIRCPYTIRAACVQVRARRTMSEGSESDNLHAGIYLCVFWTNQY